MTSLWLSEDQARSIARYAIQNAPNEVCGIIGGKGDQAQLVLPIENVASTPTSHFEMQPIALLKALKQIDAAGLSFIAVYHSHPKSHPIPSQTDIQAARHLNTIQLIISLKQRQPRLQAWHIHDGQVEVTNLCIGNNKSDTISKPGLPRSHIAAIFISTIIAAFIVLVVSLSLLPPAPLIPTPVQ